MSPSETCYDTDDVRTDQARESQGEIVARHGFDNVVDGSPCGVSNIYPRLRLLTPDSMPLALEEVAMGLFKHLINGLISVIISVVVTVALAKDGETYSLTDVVLSVAISAFLSGFFTSYFANDSG